MKKCTTIRPPSKDACSGEATYRVTWRDDVSYACTDCAVYLKQLAEQEHKTTLLFERLARVRTP